MLNSQTLKLIPGVLYLVIVGLLAKYIGNMIPYVSYLIVAIVLGIVSSNFLSLPAIIAAGIGKTHKLWLNTGIVVLGARVLIKDMIRVGPKLFFMLVVFIIFALLIVEYLSRKFKLAWKLGSCLAAGTSVCGVSAVVATGGAIEAKEKHIAYAIATILVFDVITVFIYPFLGNVFAIPAQVYGPWAGISMFSTGTTVAAGFAHSELAGQLATITKMGRNVFIGTWALLYSIYYLKKGLTNITVTPKAFYIWDKFPKIVIGFIIVLLVANSGLINSTQIGYMKNAYNWLFMLAFVGLGYSIDLKELKMTGLKPFLVVLLAFTLISLSSLGISYLFFG